MLKIGQSLVVMLLGISSTAHANFDYFENNRQMIRNGVQAVLSCNGLFTSNRSIDQVFKSELAYLGDHVVGNSDAGNYAIDTAAKSVGVGGGDDGRRIHAVFREGVGCVVVPPGWDLADNASLPTIDLSYRTPTSHLPWPMGDAIESKVLPSYVNEAALQAAEQWAFERDTPEQNTVSLLVVHKGDIVLERYADGFDRTTRTRTWSTAKSIAATLIGMKVDAGELSLDAPLGFDWLPGVTAAEADPRNKITLRHALHMSSGLYPVDSFGMEYATGSGPAYWAGASSIEGMRNRGLIREPGSFWDYENYDTLLAVYAMKQTFKTADDYRSYPHTALFEPLGMTRTLPSTDRFGDFIFSSQVYTNARDLARFGMLYLQNGMWQGKRLLSEEWIRFVRTPAPASDVRGHDYGGQWWLVPDDRKGEVPADAYSTAGNRGQYVIVVPSHELVIVRRGLDYGKQGFNRWDLLREVLKAFPSAEADD